ncbi:hypothetical protein GCQ56_07685 [Marinifilum sp. N1E240]|uniref:P27 family phage terminase small subunit n=1 Tax=Marinifilum sp. N1E240 TaxID=2608082 RepID=UPI00128D6F95|nr:P27 family phage terminase small subunit [Marinifilum sp. N1E240]MPQ46894.1 hypothetical protein [Marinifilum sp. N1E240]
MKKELKDTIPSALRKEPIAKAHYKILKELIEQERGFTNIDVLPCTQMALVYQNIIEYSEEVKKEPTYIDQKTGAIRKHPFIVEIKSLQSLYLTYAVQLMLTQKSKKELKPTDKNELEY